jgi:hypothetical protein
MFKKLFCVSPLPFRERRELVKFRWARYGYMKRAPESKTLLTIADKVNNLMVAFN